MNAWRIVKVKHRDTAYNGEGAALFGGRWNSQGIATGYAAESRALAMIELLVHLSKEELRLPYVLVGVHFDSELVQEVAREMLPENWWESPPPKALREIGDTWIRSETSAVLRVPSAIIPLEHCFLINPTHPEFRLFEYDDPEPFRFDSRLR